MKIRLLQNLYSVVSLYCKGTRIDTEDKPTCLLKPTNAEVNLFHSADSRGAIYHSSRPLQTLPLSSLTATLVMSSKSTATTPLSVRKARTISKHVKTSTIGKTSKSPIRKSDEIPWSTGTPKVGKKKDESKGLEVHTSSSAKTSETSIYVDRVEEDRSDGSTDIKSASPDMETQSDLKFLPEHVARIVDEVSSIHHRLSCDKTHSAFAKFVERDIWNLDQVTWLPYFTPQDEASVFTELRLHSTNLQIAIFLYMQNCFEDDCGRSTWRWEIYEGILRKCETLCVLHGSNEVAPEIEELSDLEVPWQSVGVKKSVGLSCQEM